MRNQGLLASLALMIVAGAIHAEPLLPTWTAMEHPGKVEVDAWGWHAGIWYQQTYLHGVDYSYLRDRVIRESYHRGANLIEVYLTRFNPVGYPIEWTPDDDIPKPDAYSYKSDPDWDNDTFRALTRLAHRYGFLVQWFCHPELVARNGYQAHFDDPAKIADNDNAFRAFGDMFADATAMDWRGIVDGFGHEHWYEDKTGQTVRAQWEYNPGQYTFSTISWRPEAETSYVGGMMCAAHGYLRGRDDQWALPGKIGERPLGYQADSRTFKPTRHIWGGRIIFGGGTYPDWIVKQTNDYFRRRLLAGGEPDASGIWWLGETDPVLPYPYRDYMYGSCQDPMRHAAAAQLRTTGRQGHMDMMRQLYGKAAPFTARFETPATGYFLQNNYLRLEIDPDHHISRLLYDPSQSAHFDNNSDAVVLAENFLTPVYFDVSSMGDSSTRTWIGRDENSAARDVFAALSEDTFAQLGPREDDPNSYGQRYLHLVHDFPFGPQRVVIDAEPGEAPVYARVWLGERFLGAFAVTDAKVQYATDFTVAEPGEKELVIEMAEGGPCVINRVQIEHTWAGSPHANRVRVVEAAGHTAALEYEFVVHPAMRKGTEVRARYRLQMLADAPMLIIDLADDVPATPPLQTTLQFDRHEHAGANLWYTANNLPSLAIVPDPATTPKPYAKAVSITGGPRDDDSPCRTVIALTTGPYADASYKTFKKIVTNGVNAVQHVTLSAAPGEPAVLPTTTDEPTVRLLRVMDPDGRPYYVGEAGADGTVWWHFRGAQASRELPGTDLLRIYTRPGEPMRIARDGFLLGLARPAWGSQYVLGLTKIKPIIANDRVDGAEVTAGVVSKTPMVFAPRVQFPWPIAHVKVNGQPWSYVDDDVAMLPRNLGTYHVEVHRADDGLSHNPRLTRTCVAVKRCEWKPNDRELHLELDLPDWPNRAEQDRWAGATIDPGGMELVDAFNAQISRQGPEGINLRVFGDSVRLKFDAR